MTTRPKGGKWRRGIWKKSRNILMIMNNENHDENEGRFDDEMREQREIEHERDCRSRDVEQGIEPAGLYD